MKILVYPHYDNPYQKLLYDELKRNNKINIKYFDDVFLNKHYFIGPILFPIPLIIFRLYGYKIFHLHWQNFYIKSSNKYLSMIFSSIYTIIFILFIKILRYKLVWTIHNIRPHESITLNDLLITKILCDLSDIKIVHSSYVIEQLEKNSFNINNIIILPMGNFIEYYKNTISSNDAKNKLNIDKNKFTILFFGLIRPYKGVEDLIDVFKIIGNRFDMHIIIAGEVYDEIMKNKILNFRNLLKGKCSIYLHRIPDDEVQLFMNSADIVVFPFKRITTSSSILLPLSFSKPIIYPKINSLLELPDNIGYGYEINNIKGLKEAIVKAYNNRNQLKLMGKLGYQYVKVFSWKMIAEKLLEIYKKY